VNETLTESRTQPVVVGENHLLDLTVLIEHRDNPDLMAITVSWPSESELVWRVVVVVVVSNQFFSKISCKMCS